MDFSTSTGCEDNIMFTVLSKCERLPTIHYSSVHIHRCTRRGGGGGGSSGHIRAKQNTFGQKHLIFGQATCLEYFPPPFFFQTLATCIIRIITLWLKFSEEHFMARPSPSPPPPLRSEFFRACAPEKVFGQKTSGPPPPRSWSRTPMSAYY